ALPRRGRGTPPRLHLVGVGLPPARGRAAVRRNDQPLHRAFRGGDQPHTCERPPGMDRRGRLRACSLALTAGGFPAPKCRPNPPIPGPRGGGGKWLSCGREKTGGVGAPTPPPRPPPPIPTRRIACVGRSPG